MLKRVVLAAALATAVISPAFAFQCPQEMKKIDAALAKDPQLTADKLAKAKQLRAEGEALHKAGNHEQSLKALREAEALLGIQ